MALALAWYDIVCFAIVAGAIAGSLWVIFQKEGGCSWDDQTEYESLLTVASGEGPTLVEFSRAGHVSSAQLWMSCWRCVQPWWLLCLRMVAAVSMFGLLSWDMSIYGSSIMVYYTEVPFPFDGIKYLDTMAFWFIAIPSVVARTVVMKLEVGDHLRSSDLWTPCWRTIHPIWLLVYRSLVVLIMLSFLYQTYLVYGFFAFYFYTTWTFMLVIVYFMVATAVSAHGCWLYYKKQVLESTANSFLKRDIVVNDHSTLTLKLNANRDTVRLQSQYVQELKGKKAGSLGYAMQIIYQTSAGAVILTDVVFWGLLVPFLSLEHFDLSMVMCCMHSLNAVFLLLDTILSSLPFPWFRMAYFVLWSCIYVIFQWVLHACGFTWWPYPFLELSTPWAPVWYIGMALVHIPCYGLYWLIVRAKNSFFYKYFPHAYIRSY